MDATLIQILDHLQSLNDAYVAVVLERDGLAKENATLKEATANLQTQVAQVQHEASLCPDVQAALARRNLLSVVPPIPEAPSPVSEAHNARSFEC